MKFNVLLMMFLATHSHAQTEPKGERIHYKWGPQRELISAENLIDGTWGLTGSSRKKNSFYLDTVNTYKGHNVYKFWASPEANRIELAEAFVTEVEAKKYPKESIERLSKIADIYGLKSYGDYGDTISYSWYTKFPSPLNKDHGGIFAQWHGRPDRTLVKFPNGEMRNLSVDEFLKLSEKITFKNFGDAQGGRRGVDKVTGKETGHLLDGAAGGPVATLSIKDGYIFLKVTSKADAISTNQRPKVNPTIDKPFIDMGTRTGALVYYDEIENIAVDEWIHFKVEIKYSDYVDYQDKVSAPGHVKMWMNKKQLVDWKGNIGKNDYIGPYFKFGIYKPKKAGFTVHHCGYERKLIKKGRRKTRTAEKLIKELK